MNRVLIFAGTTEGRKLSEYLSGKCIYHTVCVATEYGEEVLSHSPYMTIHRGRMDVREMEDMIRKGDFCAVVDATHPYAVEVTANIREASERTKLPYFRLKRRIDTEPEGDVKSFSSNEECAGALEKTEGNILLTTGSKELSVYCKRPALKERLYVRVLPGMESISICTRLGIRGRQIIAMQGPFSPEMNEAILHQYRIAHMVTKQSGKQGGYPEKLEAARRCGIPVYVVEPADTESGDTLEAVCEKICALCMQEAAPRMSIVLAGIGMGSKNGLTREVDEAIASADILLGAKRLIEPYTPAIEKKPYYLGKDILPYLETLFTQSAGRNYRIVVLFSGDSGCYSGCQALARCLQEAIGKGRLKADVRILPGISSVSYLASCIGESYQDAAIWSMHGKQLPNLAGRIQSHEKTFLLMSGAEDLRRLGKALTEAGMDDCKITAGWQLSYEEEKIQTLTPEECLLCDKEGLYTCFIHNPHPVKPILTPRIADEAFIRGKVPMTKKEIREVSICKLHLYPGAVVYDIGSGTGAVSVEIAQLSPDIRVLAWEQKPEAVELTEKNKESFHLDNITVIRAKAPDGFADWEKPTHAFIGGSGGNLTEIMKALYQGNPSVRVVVNAVSIETVSQIKEILASYPVTDVEFVQVQASHIRKIGAYHMMQAENPVFVCAFSFAGE